MPDFGTAREDIHRIFDTAWQANAGVVNGGVVPTVQYETRKIDPTIEFPPVSGQWARLTSRHATGRQSTFGGNRFEKVGIVTVQIFASMTLDEPDIRAEALAQVAVEAFQGKTTLNQVWFRNVVPVEVGVDDAWFQVNVVAEFEYDEIT